MAKKPTARIPAGEKMNATPVETPEVETPEVETPEVETPEVETPPVKMASEIIGIHGQRIINH